MKDTVTAASPFGIDFLADPEQAAQKKSAGQGAAASESFAPSLILGFGLLLAILAGVAWLVLTQSKRMTNSFDQILNNHSFAAELAAQAIHDSEANNIIVDRIAAADNAEAAESLRASLEASSQNIDRLIGKLSQTMDSDEERALLKAVLDSRARYLDHRARGLAVLFKSPGSTAGQFDLLKQLMPLVVKYQLAWNQLLQFELNQTGREAREAKGANQQSVRRMFTLLVLAVLAASLVAIVTSQSLARASAARQAAQLALRQTNDDLERRVGERTRELAESTALLDATVGSTGDGILVVSLDGKRLLQNRRTAELWTIPPSVLENSDPRAQIQFIVRATAHPQEFQDKLDYYDSHPLEKGVDEIELKDGTILEQITGPIFGNDGRNYGRIWTFRDITQRKGMERAVQQSERKFHALFEYARDAKAILDSEGRFIDANREACARLQYTREEFLHLSAQEVNTTENAGLVLTRIQQTLRQGHLLFESAQRRKDGTLVPVEVNAQALEYDGRTVVLATYRDLTERKQAAAELEKIHHQLLESSRLAGMAEVATGVLHNVGNVLNSINVSTTCLAASSRKSKVSMVRQIAELLKEHAADLGAFLTRDDRGRQVPSFLQKLAERLDNERAEALKELANLDKNVGHIKEVIAMQQNYASVSGVTSNVKVGEVIEDAVRINLAALARHGVKLVRQWDESLPEIIAERHKILQILVNLVSNAKYACAESQRPDKQVTLRAGQHNGRIQISVSDNGVGISPENLTRIFAHGFTTRKSGHGFGLHSSALAAKEMGGALFVQSDGPGQGASFTLELPLQLARGG